VFAASKRGGGLAKVRYKGIDKNKSYILLVAIAYNMNGSLKLA